MKVRVLEPIQAELAEGPCWDAVNQRLLWVDIVRRRVSPPACAPAVASRGCRKRTDIRIRKRVVRFFMSTSFAKEYLESSIGLTVIDVIRVTRLHSSSFVWGLRPAIRTETRIGARCSREILASVGLRRQARIRSDR